MNGRTHEDPELLRRGEQHQEEAADGSERSYLLAVQRAAGNSAATSLVQRADGVVGAVLRQPVMVQREETEGGGQPPVMHRAEIKDAAKLQAFDLGGTHALTGKKPDASFMGRAELGYVFGYADGYETGLREWMRYWDQKDVDHMTGLGHPSSEDKAEPKAGQIKEAAQQSGGFAVGTAVDVAVEKTTEHAVGFPVPVALIFELSHELKSDTPMFDPDERKKEREEYVNEQRQTLREAKEARVNDTARTHEEGLGDEDAGNAEQNAAKYEATKQTAH